MTSSWETFEDIVPEIDDDRMAWTAAYNEVRQASLHAEECVDVREYGRRAWQQLTPIQRALALDSLFSAYFHVIFEEEQADRVAAAVAAGAHCLTADDWDDLARCLLYPEGAGEDAVVVVLASSVANMLAEVQLLRQRLEEHGPEGGGR